MKNLLIGGVVAIITTIVALYIYDRWVKPKPEKKTTSLPTPPPAV